MNIELSKYNVKTKDSLSWGEFEELQAEVSRSANIQSFDPTSSEVKASFDPSAMINAKYKLLELTILEIKEKEGNKVVPYTKEWAYGLSREDGELLYSTIDEALNKKK